ncbi:hypothetical protein [Methylobacterium oryzisoli]|uniref:hypothetical protein n=1 Tax=Methylobacterium oryzisoli TaxID=3385502 RepID=UPI0038923416
MKNLVRLAVLAAVLAVTTAAPAQPVPTAPAETEEAEPGPPPPLPNLTEPNARSAESLNEPGPRSAIPRALRSSGSRAGGPANDLNPGGLPEEPTAPRGDLAAVLTGQDLFHGHYCGAGQRGEGLAPTDALDAACQRHDACFEAAGHRSCACNLSLQREATFVSERPGLALEIRRRALSVAQAAELMACRAP